MMMRPPRCCNHLMHAPHVWRLGREYNRAMGPALRRTLLSPNHCTLLTQLQYVQSMVVVQWYKKNVREIRGLLCVYVCRYNGLACQKPSTYSMQRVMHCHHVYILTPPPPPTTSPSALPNIVIVLVFVVLLVHLNIEPLLRTVRIQQANKMPESEACFAYNEGNCWVCDCKCHAAILFPFLLSEYCTSP